jgi:hypothetical protein
VTVAGNTHPGDGGGDDGTVMAARKRTRWVEEGSNGVTVAGNPTTRELAAVLAAVDAARRHRLVANSPGESTGGTAPGKEAGSGGVDAAGAGAGRTAEDAGANSRERVAHERRCPVCRERYDSARPLEGATSVRTAERGASTVCVDPGSKRVYVHSPPPR